MKGIENREHVVAVMEEMMQWKKVACGFCSGTGFTGDTSCVSCDNFGWVWRYTGPNLPTQSIGMSKDEYERAEKGDFSFVEEKVGVVSIKEAVRAHKRNK